MDQLEAERLQLEAERVELEQEKRNVAEQAHSLARERAEVSFMQQRCCFFFLFEGK